jgi:zinc and cadmium transporter
LILGDSFHNFLDGILIGLSYVVNPVLGLPTALAIAAHEVPQEMADFSIMVRQGWKKSVVLGINILQSLLTIPGVLIGVYMGSIVGPYVPSLLGVAAGIFIYIAATDILPELHHNSSHKHFFRVIIPTLLGVAFVTYFIYTAHHG